MVFLKTAENCVDRRCCARRRSRARSGVAWWHLVATRLRFWGDCPRASGSRLWGPEVVRTRGAAAQESLSTVTVTHTAVWFSSFKGCGSPRPALHTSPPAGAEEDGEWASKGAPRGQAELISRGVLWLRPFLTTVVPVHGLAVFKRPLPVVLD